jgi:carboxymethylenebutenolidase
MLLHFGEQDRNIPLRDVERARALFPNGVFHIYPADHGFNCNARSHYHEPSARLAWQRTQEFLKQYLG